MAETDIPNWLNSSFFETALRAGGYGPNVTVTSSEIGRVTDAGENYICDIWRAKLQVTLDGRGSTLSLIVKAQPTKEEMAKVNKPIVLPYVIYNIRSILNRNTLSTFCYIFTMCTYVYGARGGIVVKALRYKPAGSGFDSRWCHWNFSVT